MEVLYRSQLVKPDIHSQIFLHRNTVVSITLYQPYRLESDSVCMCVCKYIAWPRIGNKLLIMAHDGKYSFMTTHFLKLV